MFNNHSALGRVARALTLLALVAALFSGVALTSAPASAGAPVGTLGVHVTTTNGTTIQSAVVHLYNTQGTDVAKAETDANGNAAFKIAAGNYKVFVKADNYEVTSTATEVFAGKIVTVNITLQSSTSPVPSSSVTANDGTVVAQVNSTNGAGVGQAVVYLLNAKGVAVAKGEADSAGAVKINVPAGNYNVLVKATGFETYQSSTLIAVQSGQPTNVTVTIKPASAADTH